MCLTLAHIHCVWRLPDWARQKGLNGVRPASLSRSSGWSDSSTESASHRRLRVCSAAALRGALLAHTRCVVRYSHTLSTCFVLLSNCSRAIGNYETVTLCFVFSLFGNNFYAGLTLRARATRGLRRPTSGYRPFVGRLYCCARARSRAMAPAWWKIGGRRPDTEVLPAFCYSPTQ